MTPVEDALADFAKLAAAGSPPERVVGKVGEMVAGWAAEEDMNSEVARARIEEVWDSLGKDAADLQAAISDAGQSDSDGLAMAKRSLAALQAAVAALAAVHERLG